MFGRRSRVATAALVALVMAVGLTLPASAWVALKDQGTRGNFVLDDSGAHPGAKCGYAPADEHATAYFRWMKVFAPKMWARSTSGGRDHQQVSWKFQLQKSVNSGPWQNIRTSATQTRTAYDDTPAAFTALKVYYNGNFADKLRAIVTMKWLRNGSAEGLVKLRLEYYSVKWDVGSPAYVYTDACDGAAD
jgi:hypothetical protein